ncbi:hypothetical protein BKH43_05400 [Helicobacter sp. 13S00401-1]|uniref:hypothetical protein n=1 Tax=Helicobacter sp. 13S00401-1 TaxID=1905758 RepID=UPI000BA69EE7|nr:hypothetical protein [Helicobacter sp. 13S00401-1]PAF50177.1 hypothetical protein BKH43_05400 [Helicobacter sp. 13S00401-1]
MLKNYLEGAIKDLQNLISYTYEDIEDIKVANNHSIFERNIIKSSLIKEFETKKSLIDDQMVLLMQTNPDKPLSELITPEISTLLVSMRQNLEALKDINTRYARMVFAVSEFYTSLVEQLFPKEKADYKGSMVQSSLLSLQA